MVRGPGDMDGYGERRGEEREREGGREGGERERERERERPDLDGFNKRKQ